MLSFLKTGLVYTALLIGANAARAGDAATLAALRADDMRALVIHAEPEDVPGIDLADAAGGVVRLADFHGQVVVLNFWATWCPPCREEMPSLDRLQAAMEGRGVAVLPVATGRNAMPAIHDFFAEAGIARLPVLIDPKSALARSMGVRGLPVTVILGRDGREVARLTGAAEWDSASAVAILEALAGATN
jgi:thiol-disulfide isomerase/thioredoxin